MVSLKFFICIILPAALWPWIDSASNRNEYQESFLGGKGGRCLGADNHTTFMCRLSWNLGASASWNPQGQSRPVMGLLYLFTVHVTKLDTVHFSRLQTYFQSNEHLDCPKEPLTTSLHFTIFSTYPINPSLHFTW